MIRRLELLATFAFILAGIALLLSPSPAKAAAPAANPAFAPTRFTVVDAGTAGKPDIILLPGLTSSRAVWDGEARLLAPNFRLHRVQINGFAGAPAGPNASGPILPAVVDELHAYITASHLHPVVIGHSLGGLLALMFAEKYPADVQKLVIVDSLPFLSALYMPGATVESTKPFAEQMRQQLFSATDEQRRASAPAMAAGMVKNEDARKLVIADSLGSDRAVFSNAFAEDLTTDLRGDVAGIRTPTLLLYPYDPTAQGPDPARVDALYAGQYKPMPNVKLVRIDDSRHFIMYDQPAKLDAAIEAFLKQ